MFSTTPYLFAWRSIRRGKNYPFEYRCGSAIVMMPDGKRRQLLVMQQARFSEPMMLLSNSLDTRRANVIRLCQAYLRRWIEEGIRAIKQCLDLENLRPLTWTGIRRIVLLAFLSWAFLCKVAKTIRSKSARIFGLCKWFGKTSEFFYYRLAESMAVLLLSENFTLALGTSSARLSGCEGR